MNHATLPRRGRLLRALASLALAVLGAGCGSSAKDTTAGASGSGGHGASSAGSGGATSNASSSGSGGATGSSSASTSGSGGSSSDSSSSSSGSGGGGALPAGWLYTWNGGIYVSNGSPPPAGTRWMGRGVNVDDIFFCGYDDTLWMSNPDQTLEKVVSGLVSGWKPSFVRISLAMDSDPTVVSWLSDPSQYKTPMTNVIEAIGQNPGVYVLVTLRSDASMIGQDMTDGDPEATGLPSDATTTPDATKFPTGTDATYVALVDSFAHDSFVLFGLSNEPGGDKLSNTQISAAMSHAVGVIRAEEDHLGVPHHLVSVQGNGWTSDISFYASSPLPWDNVVYEVHGYPPSAASYTYSNIPVILGEYGSLPSGGSAAFYTSVEGQGVPNLAWDFDSYSNCAPDLLQVNQSDTNLLPTAWGMTVQSYLLAHAQ